MAKTWEQLSDAEKIEDLRSDLLRIIAKVNQLDAHSDVLERGISKIAGDLRDFCSFRVAKLGVSEDRGTPAFRKRSHNQASP